MSCRNVVSSLRDSVPFLGAYPGLTSWANIFRPCGAALPLATAVLLLQERSLLQFLEGLLELLLRVHDNRAIPCDGLFERLARHEQEADAIFAGLHGDFIAAVKNYERAVFGVGGRVDVGPAYAFGRYG